MVARNNWDGGRREERENCLEERGSTVDAGCWVRGVHGGGGWTTGSGGGGVRYEGGGVGCRRRGASGEVISGAERRGGGEVVCAGMCRWTGSVCRNERCVTQCSW